MTMDSHRIDTAPVLPATFVTATMTAVNPGTWLMNCVVGDFYDAGMLAYFKVNTCGTSAKLPELDVRGGKLRKYFIAAEEVLWDYGPSGVNNMTGGSLTEPARWVTRTLRKDAFLAVRSPRF